VAAFVALFPWRTLRWAGACLGLVVGSLVRVRRRHVESAMARAGIAPRPAARAMYASLGTALFEFLWMAGRRERWLDGQVRLTPRARAELGTRAVVIATAHTGNWDLVACAAGRALMPLTVITKRLHAAWLDAFWQGARRAQGVDLVDAAGAWARARGALVEGRSVALLIDQAPERFAGAVEATFLGAPARCDRTPALLAARARVPLVLALGRRLPDGTHLIDVPFVREPAARVSRAWVDEATRDLQSALDEFVRAHPSQWLWLHRRWKAAPARRPFFPPAPSLVSGNEGS
jgi:KDO2-lipid IV(A) lauroyltransferase